MKKCAVILVFLLLPFTALANELTLQFNVLGVTGKAKENVINQLTSEKKTLGKLHSTQQVLQFYGQAPTNIKKALEPYGYFKSQVQKSIHKDDSKYIITFKIIKGTPVRIQTAHIAVEGPGKNNTVIRKFLQHVKKRLAPGKILRTSVYDKEKQRFFDKAEDQGYLKGYFSKHQIKINKVNDSATINLVFNTGPRYYFGAIYFSKNPMATSFLRRFLPFKTEQPFSSDKLLKLQNDLNGTVYFDNVNVEPEINKAKNHHVPIKVRLKASPAQKYSIGLGYGTDTGIRGTLGWQWRRVTSSGDYLQALLQLSQNFYNSAQLSYIIPGKHPTTDHYAITAGIFNNEPGTGDDRYTTTQFGVSKVQLINGWTHTYSIQYQNESFRSNGVPGNSNTILPSISFEKIKANNRINTINGYRLFFNVKDGFVLDNSSADFFQAEFQGKYIHSFDKQNSRLLLRTDLGFTIVSDFDAMPLSQRFFAGGARSIRGFDFQELGPGRYLIVGSVEWQQRICGNFYGAVFYDAGNAFRNPPIDLQQAAGVGLLYRSPVGPIEISVAHPFTKPFNINHRDYKIQFTIGPDL